MHNNYFFLRKLSESLDSRISGYTIGTCFSQNRDELLIGLYKDQKEFWIKADLKNQFSCLSFPHEYSRAHRNSINLFPEILGKKIKKIYQHNHERAFSILLEEKYNLLFKQFGNLSNVLLYKDDRCVNVFKHGTGDESKIHLHAFDRTIEPLGTEEIINPDILKSRIPAFDKNILEYLSRDGFENTKDNQRRLEIINDTLTLLDNPTYYVFYTDNGTKFSLLPVNPGAKQFTDPIIAINHFYTEYHKRFWLILEKNSIIKNLRIQLKKTENYIDKSKGRLEGLKKAGNYRQYGDIIMANLHTIRNGSEEADLFDFYNNKNISIKLKTNLSAQKNAENYYRKAKNQKIEIHTLENNLNEKKALMKQILTFLDDIERIDNLRELRSYAGRNNLTIAKRKENSDQPRFKVYEHMGFQILVGRNAKNNDELTFRHGYKDDLWLHAKDVKGSHVLIKYQSGKNFPRPVITVAAQLAAFYSANKNSNTCPVIYTPKKFVRKRKGMPAGTVFLDKEEMIFVQPQDG